MLPLLLPRPVLFFAAVTLFACQAFAEPKAAPSHPFPQAGQFALYGLKPRNHSQVELNAAVLLSYKQWKQRYLIPSTRIPGDYKIAFNDRNWAVSEAMGYGMLITVQMAGADPLAKSYFDGLNRFRKRYPSDINPAFMNWRIKNEQHPERNDSATDGDLDMAAALLMAEAQWGGGSYQREAEVLIREIGRSLVRPDYSLRLGDWDTDDGLQGTRPSDFITADFRLFYLATGDSKWLKVQNKCYSILTELQATAAPTTGLIPDFAVKNKQGKWVPAPPDFLEDKTDEDYSYNACRVPWRIGFAAVCQNDSQAKKIVNRLMAWAVKSNRNPDDFVSGYTLKGNPLVDYSEPTFISPTGVAAMATGHQAWLNRAFDLSSRHVDYYSDSIALLSLLVMSGNSWLPGDSFPLHGLRPVSGRQPLR